MATTLPIPKFPYELDMPVTYGDIRLLQTRYSFEKIEMQYFYGKILSSQDKKPTILASPCEAMLYMLIVNIMENDEFSKIIYPSKHGLPFVPHVTIHQLHEKVAESTVCEDAAFGTSSRRGRSSNQPPMAWAYIQFIFGINHIVSKRLIQKPLVDASPLAASINALIQILYYMTETFGLECFNEFIRRVPFQYIKCLTGLDISEYIALTREYVRKMRGNIWVWPLNKRQRVAQSQKPIIYTVDGKPRYLAPNLIPIAIKLFPGRFQLA